MTAFYVGIAGFFGALFRVWLGESLVPFLPITALPYPTLIINLSGSYVLAILLFKSSRKGWEKLSPQIKTTIATGFLGSFTTFSTFSIEALELFQHHQYFIMLLYILLSFIGGLFFSWLGYKTSLIDLKGAKRRNKS